MKTKRKISKVVQMKIPKHQKGVNLSKFQLVTIATQDKTSWMERSETTTHIKEQALATCKSQMNKKQMTMVRILLYICLHKIENLPLYMNRLLTEIDMEPNYSVWKW